MIINDLPMSGVAGEYTFTLLHDRGSSNSGSDSYTTTADYDYILVVANGWGNANTPNTTCSNGTNVFTAYENTTGQHESVKVWEEVASGAVINLPGTGGRWSWQVIGVKV